MYFKLKKSRIYRAAIFRKSFHPYVLRYLRIGFLSLGAVSLLAVFLIGGFSLDLPSLSLFQDSERLSSAPVVGQNTSVTFSLGGALLFSVSTWQGLAYMSFALGLLFLFFGLFYEFYLKYPRIKDGEENMADFLSFHAAMVFDSAFAISTRMGEKEISTDSFLIAMSDYKPVHTLFFRLGVDPESIENKLLKEKNSTANTIISALKLPWLGEPRFSEEMTTLMNEAGRLKTEHEHERITTVDLLAALFDAHKGFQQLLVNLHLDKNDLKTLAIWQEHNIGTWEKKRRFWLLENLLRARPIGASWIYGFPTLLSRLSSDLSLPFIERRSDMKLVGRDKEMERMYQILTRGDRQNVLLVGESGVGKRAIVLRIAQDIAEGKASRDLSYKKVLELNVNAITSSSSEVGEVQKLLSQVLSEAAQVGNVILFIDGLHNYIGQEEGIGKTDITEVLLPHMQGGSMQIVATTTTENFHRNIETRTDLLATLDRINIEEPDEASVMRILEDSVLQIEAKHRVFFMFAALKMIYEDADDFIQTIPFPEKALSLLNEVVSYVKSQKKNIVEVADVHAIVKRKTDAPVGDMGKEEKEKLIGLEEDMHKEIVGQKFAVETIVKTMQRLRAGLSREEKPAGVFLFVGPTGVGKTLTAKVLAKQYFGSEDKIVRFDMSEFQELESADRLLGSMRQNYQGQLVTSVRDNPFSVILLDEFEKAHKDILNVFLRIFDEGKMTDVFGKKVSFRHNIIIATSNAGAQQIREMVARGEELAKGKEKLINLFVQEGYYKPELLNRFDEIVIYHPLNEEQIHKVAELMLEGLILRLKEKGYYYKVTPSIVDYIAKVGFDPQFGARPMGRAIQDKIESYIARLILEEKVKKGTEFTISVQDISD
ncbi:MAG: ATP-dependent Clp protease ATP-binding subunit [Candidatus Spechtbacterales bacterium]